MRLRDSFKNGIRGIYSSKGLAIGIRLWRHRLAAAYKFTEKGSVGIGLAYKLGLGSLDRIAISNKGAGIRSFIDYRIKNAFSLNGGMEMTTTPPFPI
ncbi:hypothetical protein [Chitinophaga pinensis]|uniref:Uncharacterized protein n=1 Tax=Chitinophaga pinensis TaxID=79329 RepID=A0A5C6LK59_9BACT|nr:hypothetical protein [Chitinophaga pinensis]TWV88732.1 hypothetical protein FEF09_30305 [Chitinophaga pinensis]